MNKVLYIIFIPFYLFSFQGDMFQYEIREGKWDSLLQDCDRHYQEYLLQSDPFEKILSLPVETRIEIAKQYEALFHQGTQEMKALFADLKSLKKSAPKGSRIEEILSRIEDTKWAPVYLSYFTLFHMQALELGLPEYSVNFFCKTAKQKKRFSEFAEAVTPIAIEFTVKSFLLPQGDEIACCVLESEKWIQIEKVLWRKMGLSESEDPDEVPPSIFNAYDGLTYVANENKLWTTHFFSCELSYLNALLDGQRAPENTAEEECLPILEKHAHALNWLQRYKEIKYSYLF